MQIIYVSNCCSDNASRKIHSLMKGYCANAAQKFHSLIVEGLAKDTDISVNAVSFIPINRDFTDEKKLVIEDDTQNGVNFHYLKTLNIKLVNNFYDYMQVKKELKKLYKKDKNCVVIYDILRLTCVKAVLSFCKEKKIKSYGIVTDVPLKRAEAGGRLQQAVDKILYKDLQKCDGYIFMTRQMNELINTQNKPWCLIECICDEKVSLAAKEKSDKKVCLYAGSLNKVYGIDLMINGFLKADAQNSVLKIYGTGDYAEQVKEAAKKHKNIEYGGLVPNEVIVQEEKKASLLVNPRPNIGEYTKYSFPSKTLEYMSSGTAMLGFKLDGIPEEYFKYMYTFEDFSEEAFVKAFKTLLSKENAELDNFGQEARRFVLENKNNTVLSKRIIDLVMQK